MQEIEAEENLKKQHFLDVLSSAEELRLWIRAYLDIDLPFDHIDPDSNSNPIHAMWTIYEAVKENKGDEISGYIMLSAREGYKTLSAAILEILILLHFQLSIAHMAAIRSQSNKAISYIQSFLAKLKKFLDHHRWVQIGDSKNKIQFQTPQGNSPYITVVVCTISGANSEHVPIMFVDEIDVVSNPTAYDEAKAIPGMERGYFPLTIKLSTRKFAFGMMSQELANAEETGDKILRWNIVDVTEKCPEDRHLPDGQKYETYVQRKLPLKNINQEEFDQLLETKKSEWEKIQVHKGCLTCPLVSVCRGRLADKPVDAVHSKKSLYKPIKGVIKTFKRLPPDMGEAQLMCWRPSTKGLVYPRFEPNIDGNVVSIDTAYEMISGEKSNGCTLEQFIELLQKLETRFYGGVDWGYTHEASAVVIAVTASGYSFIMETFGAPGLELDEFVEILLGLQRKYGVDRWFCDTAAPANIKTFKRKGKDDGVRVGDFKKDVMGGIEAIRGQVLTASGGRRLLVINTQENEKIVQGFKVHHFILDAAGNPTTTPDDEEFADVMDALRYVGQNIFGVKGSKPVAATAEAPKPKIEVKENSEAAVQINNDLMRQEIVKRVEESAQSPTINDNTGKKKKIFWST